MTEEQMTALTIAIGVLKREGIFQNAQVLKDLRTELSARRTVSVQEVNQCDGCRVGAPLTDRNNHVMPDGGYMGCTKDRYAAPIPATELKKDTK